MHYNVIVNTTENTSKNFTEKILELYDKHKNDKWFLETKKRMENKKH